MQLACLERKCEEFTVFSSCVKGPLLGIFTPNSVFFFILFLSSSWRMSDSSCSSNLPRARPPPSQLSCVGSVLFHPSSLPLCLVLEIVKRWQKTVCDRRGWERTEGRWWRIDECRKDGKTVEKTGEGGLESVGTEDRHHELEKVDWGGRFYKIKMKKGERKRWIGEWAEEKERVLL